MLLVRPRPQAALLAILALDSFPRPGSEKEQFARSPFTLMKQADAFAFFAKGLIHVRPWQPFGVDGRPAQRRCLESASLKAKQRATPCKQATLALTRSSNHSEVGQ
jgi:hypothetical protein